MNRNIPPTPRIDADPEFAKLGIHNLSMVSLNVLDDRTFKDFRNLKNFQNKNPRYPQLYRLPPFIPFQPILNDSDERYLSNPLDKPLDHPVLSASMRSEYSMTKYNGIKSLHSWIGDISKDLNP